MRPIINFTNPFSIFITIVLFVLVILLSRQTKKSAITAVMLGVFLLIIMGHTIELYNTGENLVVIREQIIKSITYDFIFILLSFVSYLWIDDIEAKEKKKKSIDDSLSWFWTKV